MVYYTDEIEGEIISLFNNKFRYGNRLKDISEHLNINSDDIAEVILSISLDIIKRNELKFKNSIFYPDRPERFFAVFFEDSFNRELHNLSNYVTYLSSLNKEIRPSFNIEKVYYILKIAKRNTLLRELIRE
jgi:hypothetical protein